MEIKKDTQIKQQTYYILRKTHINQTKDRYTDKSRHQYQYPLTGSCPAWPRTASWPSLLAAAASLCPSQGSSGPASTGKGGGYMVTHVTHGTRDCMFVTCLSLSQVGDQRCQPGVCWPVHLPGDWEQAALQDGAGRRHAHCVRSVLDQIALNLILKKFFIFLFYFY